MGVLPFMDIPIADCDTPIKLERVEGLIKWSEHDQSKAAAAYLSYEEEYAICEYKYQIGFILEDCLVTTKQLIKEIGEEVYKNERLDPMVRAHMELYYDKAGIVPPWGTTLFAKLKEEGRTIRILEGPHKGGDLKKEEKREIILHEGEIVYGPLSK